MRYTPPKYLPKLTIKPYPEVLEKHKEREKEFGYGGEIIAVNDYSIQLDGVEVKGLRSLTLSLEHGEAVIASIEFNCELDVDVDALLELQAIIKERDENSGTE